jgi:anti-sigma factor RsiW
MHLHDGELQALLDGELTGNGAASLRAHVADCEQCSAKMEAMKSAFRKTGQLLTALDESPPAISADQLIEIAEGRDIPIRRAPRGIAWAASITGLIVATVVAAAIPGSPVRTIVQTLLEQLGTESPEPIAPAESWDAQAGVAMAPDSAIEIVFQATQPGGSIEIQLIPTDVVRIEVRGDPIGFAVGDQSIQVENQNAIASYRITLPENLSQTVIRVATRTVFLKQGSRVLQNEFERDGESYRLEF